MCREGGQSAASTDPRFRASAARRKAAHPSLVFAAGLQGGEDAQLRAGEEPALRVASRSSGCADERTEMLAAGHCSKVLCADARQLRDLIFGENFLSGFDSDHFLAFF
jgi:hypothetical protein